MRRFSPLLLCLALVAAACTTKVDVAVPEGAPTGPTPTDAVAPTPTPSPNEETPTPEVPTEDPPETATSEPIPPPLPSDGVQVAGRFEWNEGACPFDEPSAVDITCGVLTVPEDWEDPGAEPSIEVQVAILSDPDADVPADPLLYLWPGGPGGHALETIPFAYDLAFRDFTAVRDVILWDQRGSGFSDPTLFCDEVNAVDIENKEQADPLLDEQAAEFEAYEQCADRVRDDGADLDEYHSVNSAHDAEALRQALGYDQWNLAGVSYGTRLAQSIMRLYPEPIRSVILDSVVPTEGNLDADIAGSAERAFEQLFAGCAADPLCSETYPDLENRLFAVIDAAATSPFPYEAANAATGEAYDLLADGGDIANLVFGALYSQSGFAAIPELVRSLEQGDTGGLSVFTGQDLANADFFSAGLLVAVRCHEEMPFLTDEQVSNGLAADPRYNQLFSPTGADVRDYYDPLCEAWGAGAADPVEEEPVVVDIPTLVLSGQYDPVTPPKGGTAVATALPTAYNYVLPHQGHAALSDDCAVAMAVDFIADPGRAPEDGCIATSTPPPWTPVPLPTSFEEFSFDEDFVRGQGVSPEGWDTQGSGVFLSQDNDLQQIIMVAQAVDGVPPEEIVPLVADNAGALAPPVIIRSFDVGARTWTEWRFDIPGAAISTYVAEGGGGATLFVLFQGPAERLPLDEAFITAILEPFDAP